MQILDILSLRKPVFRIFAAIAEEKNIRLIAYFLLLDPLTFARLEWPLNNMHFRFLIKRQVPLT